MEAKRNRIGIGLQEQVLSYIVSRAEDVDRSDIVSELKISNGAVVEKINRTFNTTDITELISLVV